MVPKSGGGSASIPVLKHRNYNFILVLKDRNYNFIPVLKDRSL